MTTPNSLNKHMMSSWSITPDQRRNAQNYKQILALLFQVMLCRVSSDVCASHFWEVILETL